VVGLDLDKLREVNKRRCGRWHGPETTPWSLADWSNAMCGEAGEAANVVKKIRRIETGTGTATAVDMLDLKAALSDELADTVIYADLVAANAGVNLSQAIVDKFNAVSLRESFPERLQLDADDERERQAAADERARITWWLRAAADGPGSVNATPEYLKALTEMADAIEQHPERFAAAPPHRVGGIA
jgi:NTP pyrophosphatase (non-canonical NTP hydrolase)